MKVSDTQTDIANAREKLCARKDGRKGGQRDNGRKEEWMARTHRKAGRKYDPPSLVETAISERTSRRRRNRALRFFYISVVATADAMADMASTVVCLEVVANEQTRPPRERKERAQPPRYTLVK